MPPAPASAYAAALPSFLAPFLRELLGAPQLGVVPGGGTEYVLFSSRLVFCIGTGSSGVCSCAFCICVSLCPHAPERGTQGGGPSGNNEASGATILPYEPVGSPTEVGVPPFYG